MLAPSQLQNFSKIQSLRPLIDIGLCWGIIVGSLWIAGKNPYLIPLLLPVIASRLHALTIIMHDGAHRLISTNKIANDVISNIFCAFPLLLSTEIYRQSHFKHHKYTQTEKDPNYLIMQKEESWHYPKTKEEVKNLFYKDLLLLTLKDHLVILKEWQILPNFRNTSRLEKYLFPLFITALVSGVTFYHLWVEFFILQLSALLINPITRMRAMSEHIHSHSHGQSKIDKLQETTTINASPLERFFISPFNTNRHLEHHLYPTVPYYRLEELHKTIQKTHFYQAHCLYELDGYFLGERTSFKEVLCEKPIAQVLKKTA